MKKKLNTVQLWYLRNAHPNGQLRGDRCTLKALRDRGYAVETDRGFFITDAGRQRARRAADVQVIRDGGNLAADPALMKNL